MPYKDKEKEKRTKRLWYERNREKTNADRKVWREENKQRHLAVSKAYREANRKRLAEKAKEWSNRNKDRVRLTNKQWRESNRERVLSKRKAWEKANPERMVEQWRVKRVKKRKARILLTPKEKEAVLLLEKTRRALQNETGIMYHIDHILPISHGGIHHPVNLRILEGAENMSKKHMILPEAIALAPEHFRLYSERISPERAWEFVRQLAEGLGLGEDDLDALITGKPLKSKPTLEDFFT